MLHILLLILKIIGIIFAVILGILVLLVCIVLFVPVRYEVTVRSPGTLAQLKGKGKVTWLFHLVRADIIYKENRLKWRVRIAWKKFLGGADYGSEKTSDRKEKETKDTDFSYIYTDEPETEGIKTHIKEDKNDEEKDDETEKDAEVKKGKESSPQAVEESCEGEKGGKETGKADEEKRHEDEQDEINRFEAGKPEEKISQSWDEETGDGRDHEDKGLYQKIKDIFNRIKCTIQSICGKIKELLEKKNRLLEFIRDESHVNAFTKLKGELFKLLRRLRPGKLDAEILFGFDDPAATGKTLAALAVFYPLYGSWVTLHPDFENKVLKGRLYGKGHIRLIHFAVLAWNLLWSRHVRSTYKDIRNFELNAEGD